MNALEKFFLTSMGITVETGLRYAFFAGVAWLLACVLFKRRWWHRKIVQREPLSADVRREMKYSLITLVIFGAVGAGTVWLFKAGWTQAYWRIEERGWGWFIGSIIATIFLHDAWF